MNKTLADTLTLGGTTHFNIRMRWKAAINKPKLAEEIVDIPGDFVDLPQYHDHSCLDYLNKLAENCGLPSIFDHVHWSARITVRYICQNISKSRW
jgi:hypothetical protein